MSAGIVFTDLVNAQTIRKLRQKDTNKETENTGEMSYSEGLRKNNDESKDKKNVITN